MNTTFDFNIEFNQWSTYLQYFALSLTKDKSAAEDLYQETALKAFKHQDKFESSTNMKAWLSTIMRNSFINLYRKRSKRIKLQAEQLKATTKNYSEVSTLNEGEMNLNIETIQKMVERLDEHLKTPFLMSIQGYRYHEIQKLLGDIPLGTIKSRIHQARKILRTRVLAHFGDEILFN